MEVLILQHADDEWIGNMEPWFLSKGANLTTLRVDKGEPLPAQNTYDWLLIMGGPMSVYDQSGYPWLITEKEFIKEAIALNKRVLGICLGAQLIASALGCIVKPNCEQEIGWFEVIRLDPKASNWLPDSFKPLSWHGDIFDLPNGAVALAKSALTPYQGFTLSSHVVALQFHLEAQRGTAKGFMAHETDGLPSGPFVQSRAALLEEGEFLHEHKQIMHRLLDSML